MGDGRLLMPHHPSRSDSPDETRLSILTAESHTGAPYPEDNGNMPSSGHTPPPGHRAPVSEFPELSELILGGSDIGGASSFLSDRSGAGQSYLSRTGLGIGAPSIASLNLLEDLNDDDRVSAASSGTRGPPTTVHPAFSELSFESMSQPTSTVLAKERKDKGRRRRSERGIDELSEIREVDGSQTSSRVNPVTLFFAEQREREQEKALSNPSYLDRSVEVRHVSTVTGGGGTFDERRLDKVNAGHPVYDIGASPSMCSTPVLGAHSAVASVLNPSHVGSALSSNNNNNSATFTNNDSFDNSRSYTNTPSNLSRPDSRPVLGSSAYPVADDPMPAYGHHHFADDDDEINTNPSIIQGPGGHHQSANWEMANGYSDRGLTMDDDEMRLTPISPQANSRLGNTPLGKDEGYISAANPIGSPGSASPVGMRGDAGMGAIDDMLSDAEFYRGQQRNRMSSGNSHGMPSPLYDSSTGRGIERIESKDIVALMEHVRLS